MQATLRALLLATLAVALMCTRAEASDCAAAGAGFKKHTDLDVCARLGIDATAEFGQTFARHDLVIETGRTEDGFPSVAYGSPFRTSGRHKVSGNFLLRPSLSAVTPTDFGPLRVHVRASESSVAEELAQITRQPIFLDDAWVSVGVLTAGRRFSFFDYNPGFNYKPGYTSYRTTNMVALTSPSSEGLRGSLSLEDSSDRRRQDGLWASYRKRALPDLVGAVHLDRDWGNAHASVALHGITPDQSSGCASCGQQRREVGFASSVGAEYRHKFGDTYGRIMVSGALADGALDYLGIPTLAPDYKTDVAGLLKKTQGVSGIASYEHVWQPNLKTSISLSVFRTRSSAGDFRWETRGYIGQFGAEYMPAPDIIFGVELAHLFDAVRAEDAASTGPLEGASLDRVLFYTRRSF